MWKSGGGMDTRDGVRLRNFAGGGTGGSHDIEVEIVEVRETDFDVTLKGWYQWNGMGKTSHIDNILTILVEEGKGRLALGPNHEVLLRLEDY